MMDKRLTTPNVSGITPLQIQAGGQKLIDALIDADPSAEFVRKMPIGRVVEAIYRAMRAEIRA